MTSTAALPGSTSSACALTLSRTASWLDDARQSNNQRKLCRMSSGPTTLQLLLTLGFILISSAGSIGLMVFITQLLLRHVPPDQAKLAQEEEAAKKRQQAAIIPDHL